MQYVLRTSGREQQHAHERAVFHALRTHHMDLNLMCDADPAVLLANLPAFVAQIDSPDYLTLFISALRFVLVCSVFFLSSSFVVVCVLCCFFVVVC